MLLVVPITLIQLSTIALTSTRDRHSLEDIIAIQEDSVHLFQMTTICLWEEEVHSFVHSQL